MNGANDQQSESKQVQEGHGITPKSASGPETGATIPEALAAICRELGIEQAGADGTLFGGNQTLAIQASLRLRRAFGVMPGKDALLALTSLEAFAHLVVPQPEPTETPENVQSSTTTHEPEARQNNAETAPEPATAEEEPESGSQLGSSPELQPDPAEVSAARLIDKALAEDRAANDAEDEPGESAALPGCGAVRDIEWDLEKLLPEASEDEPKRKPTTPPLASRLGSACRDAWSTASIWRLPPAKRLRRFLPLLSLMIVLVTGGIFAFNLAANYRTLHTDNVAPADPSSTTAATGADNRPAGSAEALDRPVDREPESISACAPQSPAEKSAKEQEENTQPNQLVIDVPPAMRESKDDAEEMLPDMPVEENDLWPEAPALSGLDERKPAESEPVAAAKPVTALAEADQAAPLGEFDPQPNGEPDLPEPSIELIEATPKSDSPVASPVSTSTKQTPENRSAPRARVRPSPDEVASGVTPGPEAPDRSTRNFEAGLAKVLNADYPGAVAEFDKVLALEPESAEALINRGSAKYSMADHEGAVGDCTAALKIRPGEARAYCVRARALMALGKLEQAAADCAAVLKTTPDHAESLCNRSVIRQIQGDHEGALADLNRVVEAHPRTTDAYLLRGVTRQMLGKHDEAIADYTQAIQLNPKMASAYTNRALVCEKQHNLRQAHADIEKAIGLTPDNPKLYRIRGRIRYSLGQYDEAHKDLDIAANLAEAAGTDRVRTAEK